MAKEYVYSFNGSQYILLNPLKEKLSTQQVLNIMLDTLSQINESDDASFVLKMKLLNNIEFLTDQLMHEYNEPNQ